MSRAAITRRQFAADVREAIAQPRLRPNYRQSTAAQVRLRNKLHGHLSTWQPAQKRRRGGKPYRCWNAGKGWFVLHWIEQTSQRVFWARSLLSGTLGKFSNWWDAAECCDMHMLGELSDI